MLVRISALVAIASSAIAFALCIVLLTAGDSPDNTEANFWLSVRAPPERRRVPIC